MTRNKPTLIYALRDPRDNRVRYVGKTVNKARRFSAHSRCPNGQYKSGKWLQELKGLNLKPIMEILETVPPKQNWAEREIYWIACWREREPDLTNISNGGQDAPSYKQQRVTIERRLATINERRAQQGKPLLKLGRSISEQKHEWNVTKRKDKRRAEGALVRFSPEWKAKIAASLKARYESLSSEEQDKIKQQGYKGGGYWTGKKRGPLTPEQKAKKAAAMKEHWDQVRISKGIWVPPTFVEVTPE